MLVTGFIAAAAPAVGQVIHEDFKLLASDGKSVARFGNSVAINGDLAVIGSVGWGAAYIVDIREGRQLFKLVASDAGPPDMFGESIS